MILTAEEKQEELDQAELESIIQRLNMQSGPYGHKRKDLLGNLFSSIQEMALPGFIEYLFYGYEQKENESSSFFCPENYENSEATDSKMGDDMTGGCDIDNEESYEQEVLGVDSVTGKEFTRKRKRKPMRYYLPGLIGGRKSPETLR